MKFLALLTVLTPAISAWRLQLYADQQYRNILEDRSGTLGQPCKDLPAAKRNRASSMHWDADGLGFETCEIVLYNWSGCREAGGILGRSEGNWNLPAFSTQADNKVESYKINC